MCCESPNLKSKRHEARTIPISPQVKHVTTHNPQIQQITSLSKSIMLSPLPLFSVGSKWSWDNGNCLKTPPSKEPYFSGKEIYFGVLLGNTVTVQNLKERRRRKKRRSRSRSRRTH